MPKDLPTGVKKSRVDLAPDEAVAGIALVAAVSDAEADEYEYEAFIDLLFESDVFADYDDDDIQKIVEKLTIIIDEEGLEALFNKSLGSLPDDDYREAAFVVSIGIILADGEVGEEEEKFIGSLQDVLGVSSDRAQELVDEILADDVEDDFEE